MDHVERTVGVGALLVGLGTLNFTRAASVGQTPADVTPAEDLMFEHGLIGRMLLIYKTATRRIEGKEEFPPDIIGKTARLLRKFGEDYHEKNEETYVFPRCKKANVHVDLVETLLVQHKAGRNITDRIMMLTEGNRLTQLEELAELMHSFSRMYNPHIDWENSELFRAFQALLPTEEYHELGEQFEDKEHNLFGQDGFDKIRVQIATIEKQLGIDKLSSFTP